MEMYEKMGFKILAAELQDRKKQEFNAPLPWDIVELIGTNAAWVSDPDVIDKIHTSSYKLWKNYKLGQKVLTILNDPIIGDDGDITESRDYGSYVRQMDELQK